MLAHDGVREFTSLVQVRGEANLVQVRGEGAGKTTGMMKSRMAASDLILDQISKLLNSTLPR